MKDFVFQMQAHGTASARHHLNTDYNHQPFYTLPLTLVPLTLAA